MMIPADPISNWRAALPFWLSLTLVPLAVIEARFGGWTLILLPLWGWVGFTLLDALTGVNTENADPDTPEDQLFWYRLITLIWFPLQSCTLFGLIWYATHSGHLSTPEKIGLFFGMGVISGSIGINYSHELMHQKPAWERWLGDLLLASVLYGHFRSEHLKVHHLYVGTPRDAVTARYNGASTASSPACCANARNPPSAPNARCWRAAACPGGMSPTRSGATARWRLRCSPSR